MKKLSKYILLILLLTAICFYGRVVSAQLPIIPPVTTDPPGEFTEAMKLGGTTVKSLMSVKNQVEVLANNVKSAVGPIASGNFGALLDGSLSVGQMKINECSGMKTAECKKVFNGLDDDYEAAAASYQKSLKTLFLTYPEKATPQDEEAYRKKAHEFYEDNVVEVYTATIALEAYLAKDVRATMDEAKKALTEGGSGAPAPDGKNEAANAQAKAYESIDSLLKVLQQATALKAQLRSARVITNEVAPISYEQRKKEDADASGTATGTDDATDSPAAPEQAFLNVDNNLRLASSAHINNQMPLAFAQIMKGAANQKAVKSIATVESTLVNNSSESQKIVGKVETFASAPESDIFHPYVEEEEKLTELVKITDIDKDVSNAQEAHNIMANIKSYQDSAKSYKEMIEKHKKSIASLKSSEQCVLKYLGRRFANPEVVWSGNVVVNDITNYSARKGISGWAIASFETAKAARVSPISTEDIITPSIDDSKIDTYADIANMDETIKSVSVDDTFTASPSQREGQEKEMRETEMLSWQTGAEAAKMLVQEPAKWGSLQKSFPIWTDSKSFYNQYLDGKYNNIKAYLKMISASDVKALIVAGNEKKVTDSLKQKDFAILDAEATAQNQKLAKEQSRNMTAHKQAAKGELSVLEKQKAAIGEKLDTAAAEVKSISDRITDLRQQIRDDSANSLQRAVVKTDKYSNYSQDAEFMDTAPEKVNQQKIDKTIKRLQEDTSLQSHSALFGHFSIASAFVKEDRFEQDYQYGIATSPLNLEISQLESQLVGAKQKVVELQTEFDQITEQIKQQKLLSQDKVLGLSQDSNTKQSKLQEVLAKLRAEKENKFLAVADQAIDDMAEKIARKLQANHLISSPNLPFTGLTKGMLVKNLNEKIDQAISDLYAKMEKRVDAARKQLADMGDKLYDPANHGQVVKIHENMIKDLQAMVLTVKYDVMDIALTAYMYEQLIPANTAAEEEDYFVGNPAKERDLQAPMMVSDYKLANPREIVHFDDVDKQNVSPYMVNVKKSNTISRDDFLGYGGEVPPIWQLLLKDKAFVETDINLKEVLNVGCTQVAFLRGGFMPCQIQNSGVTLDVTAEGKYVRAKGSSNDFGICPNLEYRDGKVYNTVGKVSIPLASSGNGMLIGKPLVVEAADCTYSELGMLLDADSNNTIFFREKTFDIFYTLIKGKNDLSANNGNSTYSEEDQARSAIYGNAPLAVNQVSNFLKYVENEQSYRRVVEELKISNDEMMKTLFDILKSFGFEPGPGFDITRDADYNLARKKLDSYKNSKISQALSKIAAVNTVDNEVAEERVDKYSDIIRALQKDKDEMTSITDVVTDDNNLDEAIKSAKVNENVSQKYDDMADKVAKDMDKIASQPYCAIY